MDANPEDELKDAVEDPQFQDVSDQAASGV